MEWSTRHGLGASLNIMLRKPCYSPQVQRIDAMHYRKCLCSYALTTIEMFGGGRFSQASEWKMTGRVSKWLVDSLCASYEMAANLSELNQPHVLV